MLPQTNPNPPFRVTRASHVALTVSDLQKSRDFYRDVIGLVVTEETDGAVFLRGLEESAHHSLILEATHGGALAKQIGFRVRTEEDLDIAEEYLANIGIASRRVQRPHQGPTLQFNDVVGTGIELTSSMDLADRRMQEFHEFRAGAPQRLDHFQVVTHDVRAATDFWVSLGMRISEYTAGAGEELWGTWMEVKGNTHDLVFTNGRGPRLHHFAYTVPDATSLIHAADVAGSLGFGDEIDRGPGRHGISNALFLYLRDPDQHRLELFTTHYQFIDLEERPIRWDLSNTRRAQLWGMPASARWFFEASEFEGQPVNEPLLTAAPKTLEDYLSAH